MKKISNVIIKMQKYEYMRRFLLHGEMYMNTLQTFVNMDESYGIGDKFENSTAFIHYKPLNAILKLKSGEEILIHPSDVKVREFVDTNIGNIYSMALVDCNVTNHNGKYVFSIESLDTLNTIGKDYDTIVVISDPMEFISRCERCVRDMGFELYHNPVEYFSDKDYNKRIEITPFIKRDKYKSQCEFRLFADFNTNKPVILRIGDISDIAFLVHKSGINSLIGELPEVIS